LDITEIVREERILHNQKYYSVYCCNSTFRAVDSRRLRLDSHAGSVGETRNEYNILDGNYCY